jgi:hypothetical protein
MFGSFWRARRRWCSAAPEGENSTDGDFSTARRPNKGQKSPLVDFSSMGDEVVFRPEPRTPGPGAAWSGGRL